MEDHSFCFYFFSYMEDVPLPIWHDEMFQDANKTNSWVKYGLISWIKIWTEMREKKKLILNDNSWNL